MRQFGYLSALTLLASLALPHSASADRRYFVDSRTPYLPSAGSLEMETWSTAYSGRGDSTNTAWKNRVEFECGITDRLTGSFYLNFSQAGAADAPARFDGPSIELLCALAERGRLPLDPALYLEVRENGGELELEPKLLLAARSGDVVLGMNVIGEFESIHHPAAGEPKSEKAFEVTAGLSREFGARFAFGLESGYRRHFADEGPDAAAIFAGPTINLQTEKVQLALGWHPQVWGSPSPTSGLNLRDFSRSEVRLILGIDL